MKTDLIRCESVCRARFACERDMSLVSLDADQVDVEAGGLRCYSRVVHPAAPTASELGHHERLTSQLDRAERGRPLRDVGVPVRRDRQVLDFPRAAVEHERQELRVGTDAEEV